jgi:hypothetical protein
LEWIQQWRRAEQSGYIDIEDVKRQRLLESNTEADRIVQTKRQVTTLWKRLICNANQTELRFYAGNWEQKDEKNEGKYLLERLMQTEACQIKDLISTLNHTYRMAELDLTKTPRNRLLAQVQRINLNNLETDLKDGLAHFCQKTNDQRGHLLEDYRKEQARSDAEIQEDLDYSNKVVALITPELMILKQEHEAALGKSYTPGEDYIEYEDFQQKFKLLMQKYDPKAVKKDEIETLDEKMKEYQIQIAVAEKERDRTIGESKILISFWGKEYWEKTTSSRDDDRKQ